MINVRGDSNIYKNGYKKSKECKTYRILMKKTQDNEIEYNEN